ncbi:LamG domain-containing protein [Paenibacillus ginsengarvi]|uniref:LamG domain-containing protein n=1 Tax=Paenibacillus ginsengarvi TaxID=400777 RepID=UPI0013152CF4|nr:LamG domain-containing protein [Paenibacillus ginsengarvi]
MNRLRDGLLGEYLFDGCAADSSGNGNDGRVEGAALTANRFGEADRALAFTGRGECIVLDPPPALREDAFALSLWVKYDENAVMEWWNNALVSQDDHGLASDQTRRVFQLSTMGEHITWHRMMKSADLKSKQPVRRGVWVHVAAVYGDGLHRLYVNGELHDSQAGAFAPNLEEPIYIGKKNSPEPRFFFHGALDDIRIYNRTLSPEEVCELFTEHGYTGELSLDPGQACEPVSIPALPNVTSAHPFPVKKTLLRQSFNWNDCYNSLALAIHGAIQYSSRPVGLAQTLVYTGQAFVMNTDTTAGPMDVYGDGRLLQEGLENLGFDMEVLEAGIYGGSWEEDTIQKTLEMIRESINRGIAVVGWNLDNYEHGLIYGYDDERQMLNIHDINARQGGELSYGDFGRRSRNGTAVEPELFVLVLRERERKPHINATRYTAEDDASYKQSLRAALSLAVRHMEDDSVTVEGRRCGIAAFEAWIAAFEAGSAHPFFTSYNLLWITSTRQYVVPFFAQSAITHCMSLQDHKLQRYMLDLAGFVMAGYQAWVKLRELFPFPKSADTTEPLLKAKAIRLLQEAREAEIATLELLRETVKHLSAEAEPLTLTGK